MRLLKTAISSNQRRGSSQATIKGSPNVRPKEFPIKPVYTAVVTSTGGRHGHAKSADGALSVDLMPPSPTVQNPKRTNPEQLFAAGYSACFAGAMEYVAKQRNQDPGLITIIAKVALG